MARKLLILWRYEEALASYGVEELDSVGSQMENVEAGDHLFICATTKSRLYLLGELKVRSVARERDRAAQRDFGRYRADCENLSGPFGLIPLNEYTWQIRFINTRQDRLNPHSQLGMQLLSHRDLSDQSAKLL